MSTIIDFARENPGNTFILICSSYYILKFLIIRGYRTIMVCIRGWPPSHLDADGDWKPDQMDD